MTNFARIVGRFERRNNFRQKMSEVGQKLDESFFREVVC